VVRGTVVLPHGLGKAVRVLVIASGEKVREAQESGADFVAAKTWSQKSWVAGRLRCGDRHADMMKSAGKLGKVLDAAG